MITRMYIAVLDEFPDYMTPTLVAHSVLGAHFQFQYETAYIDWLEDSFRKCVVRVNRKEFEKIRQLPNVYVGHENNTLNGDDSCIVVCPYADNADIPKVLTFAKLWAPKNG